ncbi:MAG: ribosome small subunit-dependent GTPase A [Flavobacteriales bacterium]
MKGLVVKSTGSWYKIRKDDGEIVDARTRGKLRTVGIKSTNPVAVGDHVEISQRSEGDWSIDDLSDRKNYIIRKATKLSKQTHIVAANMDLAIVLVTLMQPKLKLGFLDRMLVTTEAYNIPTIIVFNKVDVLSADERQYLNDLCKAYKDVGYDSLQISVLTGEGIDQVKERIEGKTTVISGHSGVGKSSLLNTLNPSFNARVTDVSDFNEKGQHTTTFAELFEVNDTTFIIDTPGLKSFGLISMDREELKDYFPEMHRLSENCKFYNCLHINEPGCAVKPAYEQSQLPWFRYENYLHLYEELKGLELK